MHSPPEILSATENMEKAIEKFEISKPETFLSLKMLNTLALFKSQESSTLTGKN